jgi:hypothetical protein
MCSGISFSLARPIRERCIIFVIGEHENITKQYNDNNNNTVLSDKTWDVDIHEGRLLTQNHVHGEQTCENGFMIIVCELTCNWGTKWRRMEVFNNKHLVQRLPKRNTWQST